MARNCAGIVSYGVQRIVHERHPGHSNRTSGNVEQQDQPRKRWNSSCGTYLLDSSSRRMHGPITHTHLLCQNSVDYRQCPAWLCAAMLHTVGQRNVKLANEKANVLSQFDNYDHVSCVNKKTQNLKKSFCEGQKERLLSMEMRDRGALGLRGSRDVICNAEQENQKTKIDGRTNSRRHEESKSSYALRECAEEDAGDCGLSAS